MYKKEDSQQSSFLFGVDVRPFRFLLIGKSQSKYRKTLLWQGYFTLLLKYSNLSIY